MFKFVFSLFFMMPFFLFAKGYGIATLVKGSVQVVSADGKTKNLKRGDKVYEEDSVVTATKSVVRIVMLDTNIIDVYPNSKLHIKQYIYAPEENNKNVKLEVVAGRIKSTVKQKYDNDKNKYNVRTPAIVAGVRGTIFTTEHESKSGVSRVFTHEGNVMVGKLDAQDNVKEFFSVKANQQIQIDRNTEKPEVLESSKTEIQKLNDNDKESGLSRSQAIEAQTNAPSSQEKNQDSPKSGDVNAKEKKGKEKEAKKEEKEKEREAKKEEKEKEREAKKIEKEEEREAKKEEKRKEREEKRKEREEKRKEREEKRKEREYKREKEEKKYGSESSAPREEVALREEPALRQEEAPGQEPAPRQEVAPRQNPTESSGESKSEMRKRIQEEMIKARKENRKRRS